MFSSKIMPEDIFLVEKMGWKTFKRLGSYPGKFTNWIGPWLFITELFLPFKALAASFSAVSLARKIGK